MPSCNGWEVPEEASSGNEAHEFHTPGVVNRVNIQSENFDLADESENLQVVKSRQSIPIFGI
jgi:hypothetical protein